MTSNSSASRHSHFTHVKRIYDWQCIFFFKYTQISTCWTLKYSNTWYVIYPMHLIFARVHRWSPLHLFNESGIALPRNLFLIGRVAEPRSSSKPVDRRRAGGKHVLFVLLRTSRQAHTSTRAILPPLLPKFCSQVRRTLSVTPPASLLPPRKRYWLLLSRRWLTARKSQYHRVHRVQCPRMRNTLAHVAGLSRCYSRWSRSFAPVVVPRCSLIRSSWRWGSPQRDTSPIAWLLGTDLSILDR